LKDDQGNVPSAAADVNTRLPTSHRYYVKDLTLSCATAGGTGQALVPNVETLQITYGVSSGWQIDQPDKRRPVRYVDATQVTNWADVVAVHLCVLMRSSEPVLDKGETATHGYTDCDGTAQTATDGYLRRAYATTVALRNRVAP
jgi:type IV pilus assembly protein PilW